MALKTYVEADGIIVTKRGGNRWYNKTKTENNETWLHVYWEEYGEEVMEWPALTKASAEAQVDAQTQPGTGSDWDYAEWEMVEDHREVGSYILTRSRTYRDTYLMAKYKLSETG